MKRLADWSDNLIAYIDRTGQRPFAWGEHDCALWAAGAVDAMCGTDLRAMFAGQYDSLAGANEILAAAGWVTLADAAREWCGEPMTRPLYARRGDLAWIPGGIVSAPEVEHGCLGIVFGKILAPAHDRLARVPLSWVVGRGARVFAVGAV